VCGCSPPTYIDLMARRATAAKPHVLWLGEDPAARRWPVGGVLLEMLGDLNSEVRDALADERARLGSSGYPEDLPLPALWWTPRARRELVVVAD
jgi:hypothetical protein